MEIVENKKLEHIGLDVYNGNEPYIFISYSHKDTTKVKKILKRIEDERFRFWYDDTMEVGTDFRDELRKKIENCQAFLIFVSRNSMKSSFCSMELILAYKYEKRIFPVVLDETKTPPAFELILNNLQHVKDYSAETKDSHISNLINSLPPETMHSLKINGDILERCKDGNPVISIPRSVRIVNSGAFKNCEKLEHLEIGVSVESLMTEACRGCKSLIELYLPQNVRSVGESAFRDCTSLKSLVVDNDKIELGERAFENCASLTDITLADGISEIYGGVFNSCKALSEIKLPEKLTVLGESSFADCVSLTRIDIPQDVTKIDDMAFNGCINLTAVNMKDKITKIGKYTFKDCKSLNQIHIPASVNFIGHGAFRGCTNLSQITVNSKNRYFKSVENVLFNKNKSVLLAFSPEKEICSYTIPDSVTAISAWAFCDCHNLTKISIPDSVTEIGEGAFYQCTSLNSIVIPDSVNKIDDTAFRGCENLERIVIPDSVIEFGWGIFNGCNKIHVICSDKSSAALYCDNKKIPHSEE